MAIQITDEQLEATVRERFGFPGFRPGQREAISTLLRTGGLLCIQPTGYGKSLLYQLPSVLLDGITLVVSPLLALMRDQIDQLGERFGVAAASINSDQSDDENALARSRAASGELEILFVAPEQLDHVERAEFLLGLPVSLVVVDEAHCISTWGHDFRPAYREIARLVRAMRERRPDALVLGLTATADERAERDIAAQLAPDSDSALTVMRRSMDRPNLALSRVQASGMGEKLATLEQLLPTLESPGLIYCATRDHTEIVAEYLSERGLDVVAYHAGKDPEKKRELQRAFLAGEYAAISATNALGMGIDKSDLRYVLHFDIPGSITAYYQEVGRAGRDGEPARGVLVFDRADRQIQDHFIHSAKPTPDDFVTLARLARRRHEDDKPARLTDLKRMSGLHPTRVTVVVAELVEQGLITKQKHKSSQVYVPGPNPGPADLERYERQEQVRTRELDRMMAYGRGEPECLMQSLRVALGDDAAEPCGRCVACTGEHVVDPPSPEQVQIANDWLLARPVVVRSSSRPKMAEGLAVYDGTLRVPEYVRFMRKRRDASVGLDPETARRLVAAARRLDDEHGVRAVLAVPSSTWAQRAEAAQLVADELGAELLLDPFMWKPGERQRQGELLNNDQRRANVSGMLMCAPEVAHVSGPILLLDDYTGSGATFKEATRALQKGASISDTIVPLAVARVRWKLGQAGMV